MTEKDRLELRGKLAELFDECCLPDWDGVGSLPLSEPTYNNAVHFVKSLAANEFIPPPDITADPDGEISFEWYKNKRWVFSVSIGNDCMLSYAGLFGESKIHGTEVLDRVELVIPTSILQHIYRVYEENKAR